ncbi:MAG TPA: M28 family peptidase [Vicinamibacteria bacterium]|nr:M28 family peptidase [Vicinamibacteria bacterium]
MTRHAALPLLASLALMGQAPATARVSPAERTAAAAIRAEGLRADVRYLASDLLEGRGPATRGDRLARAYIAARMEAIGLEPSGDGGGFVQGFDLVSVKTRVERFALHSGAAALALREGEDFVAFPGAVPDTRLQGEVVFVGYGIQAPEFEWDDYKGQDLAGKVLLLLNSDPEDDPRIFAGKARLYYGRYDYKYAMAAKLGAAGALLIHTDHSAGYGWQVVRTGWAAGRERFQLPTPSLPAPPLRGWLSEEAARRLARLAGRDLEALRAAAQERAFRPTPLGVTLDAALAAEVHARKSGNVIGRLAGGDPALAREAVLYTAHHDHLGLKADARPGEDAVFNGALDNASGVASMLAIAEAMKALPSPPGRTVYFAAVGAEEQGLLGSEYLAAHLPVPAGRLAANLNIDGVNIYGRTRDVVLVGFGKSNLDDRLRALAAMQGRVVVADLFPDKGFFYRSDQLNFARLGVPAAYADAGVDVIGKPAGWGREQQLDYEAEHYHQVSDELRDWNLEGAVEDARLFFHLGMQVANAARMPAWKPGDEFEPARKKALSEAAARDAGAAAARP